MTGTITGLDRSITAGNDDGGSEQLSGLIETDAQLQPGDSGGPLFDGSGRVIGMDTAASSDGGRFFSQMAAGDSYAIPIRTALDVARQITSGESSSTVHVGGTAFLGVQLGATDQGYGSGYGYWDGYGDDGGLGGSTAGAPVAGVVSGSPADDAGLAGGDEITAIDGTAIGSVDEVSSLILTKTPGSKVSVTWLDQSGSQQTSTVTLASGPPQ